MKRQFVKALLGGLFLAAGLAQAQDVVRIGTLSDYPPFEYKDASGQLKGMEIELGNAMCKHMQAKCEYVTMDFDALIPALKDFPSFILVVFALGFFTSARIAEQVRAGIQSLPKGQRYAGLAMGLTLPQTYRYVLLPMAFRIVIPPLTSESMNIIKNSSVAFAVSIAELTMFAMQAQEETSRGIEVYLAVTGLYFISAFVINRIALFIEHKVQVPGMIGGH